MPAGMSYVRKRGGTTLPNRARAAGEAREADPAGLGQDKGVP